MKKMTYNQFKRNLSTQLRNDLLQHFNSIYEVKELGEQELYIAYLAYLLNQKALWVESDGTYNYDASNAEFDEEKAGYWEEEEWHHGYHPAIDSYYDLEKIQDIVQKHLS